MSRRIVPMLLLATVLAGCGGSENEPEAAPARQEFIAEGDAICAEGQQEALELRQRAQELEAQRGTVPDEELLDDAAALWNDQIAVIERFRDRFADLDPPAGEEERVEEFVATFDE